MVGREILSRGNNQYRAGESGGQGSLSGSEAFTGSEHVGGVGQGPGLSVCAYVGSWARKLLLPL